MTLHDRMKKNEFGYVFANSASLACKIWALVNDWEASLIHNPDHQNAKQVLNAVTLFHKTEKSKKIMRYLNKQNFRVRHLKTKQEMGKWRIDGEIGTTPSLKGVSIHNSIDNVDEESKSISLHFPNPLESMCCTNNATMCKSVQKSHLGLSEEISPCSIWKIERPTIARWVCRWLVKKLSGTKVFLVHYLVAYWWYTPRQRCEPTLG